MGVVEMRDQPAAARLNHLNVRVEQIELGLLSVEGRVYKAGRFASRTRRLRSPTPGVCIVKSCWLCLVSFETSKLVF